MKTGLHKLSIKIMLSYFLILLIPSSALIGVYAYAIDYTILKEKQKNVILLTQTMEAIDQKLAEIMSIIDFFSVSKNLNSRINQINRSTGGDSFYHIYMLCQETPNFSLTNKLIKDIYFLLNNTDYIVQLPWAYMLNETNYSSFIKFNGVDYGNFHNKFVQKYSSTNLLVLPEENSELIDPDILFVRNIPADSVNASASLIITLNNAFLFDALNSLHIGSEGIVSVTGADSTVIAKLYGTQANQELSGRQEDENYLVTSVTSNFAGWTYTMSVSKNLLLENVDPLRKSTLVLVFFSITLGTSICIYTVSKKTKGFNVVGRLASSVSVNQSLHSGNEYDFLQEAFSSILSTNNRLSDTIDQQKTLFDAALIRQIVYNSVESEEYYEKLLQKSSLNLNADEYCLLIIKIQNISEKSEVTDNNLLMVLIKDSLKKNFGFRHNTLDIDNSHLAVMLLFNSESRGCNQTLKEIIDETYDIFLNKFGIELFYAVSGRCRNLFDIHMLFNEAWDLINLSGHKNIKKYLFSESVSSLDTEYFYPLTVEIKLIQLLRGNEKEKLEQTLNDIYDQNLVKRNLSLKTIEKLCDSIKLSVMRGILDMPLNGSRENLIESLDDSKSINEIFDNLYNIHSIVCENAVKRFDEKNSSYKNEIASIINKNFVDPGFNISLLADALDVNDSSIYKSFKTYFGVSFTDYLENMRIEKSCALLLDGQTAIKDIPSLIGYNSDYTFRRAFKRLVGLTPSEYRKARPDSLSEPV